MIRKILVAAFVGILSLGVACSKPHGSVLPVPGGPPLGHYTCWTSGFDKLYSGEFDVLPNGRYMGVLNRGGEFVYEPITKKIVFTSGDFEYWDFVAVYQTASESKDGQERLVLKDESWESPIGQERPGDYHYCYLDKQPRDERTATSNVTGK